MSGGNDRRARPTIPFDSQMLARQSEEDAEAIDELGLAVAVSPSSHPRVVSQPVGPRLAAGTSPPRAKAPLAPTPSAPAPSDLRARTSTVHDPLTTSVLAEIARRVEAHEPPSPAPAVTVDDDDDELTPPARPPPRPTRPAPYAK